MKKVRLGQLKEKEKENALNEIRILASINYSYIIAFKVPLMIFYTSKYNFRILLSMNNLIIFAL